MVDVAIRALSAATNDPTTAVQVLNHLEDLLRLIGSTPLRGHMTFQDGSGTSRRVIPGRKWEDHLTLAVTEIREYGSGAYPGHPASPSPAATTGRCGCGTSSWMSRVAVLLRVYAKCIAGRDQIARKRIEDALRDDENSSSSSEVSWLFGQAQARSRGLTVLVRGSACIELFHGGAAGVGCAAQEAGDELKFVVLIARADLVHCRVHSRVEAEYLRGPVAQGPEDDAAAVGGVAVAGDPAAAFEPVEDAGHGGGLEDGAPRQHARAERAVAVDEVKALQAGALEVEMVPDLVVEQ